MVWPVIYEASSEARNATNLDMSSPLPNRPRGIDFSICFLESLSKKDVISVSIYPGATQFTVMFLEPNSFASDLVKPLSADFDEE